MAINIPERIQWAVGVLQVRPADRILEVGCGSGAAVSLVCDQLESGHVTAIDRSEKMVRLAREQNRQNVEARKAAIHCADLLTAGLEANGFTKVFLFNLNIFWMDPVAELDEIRRLLAANGSFYIFHNPPPGSELEEYAEAIEKNLIRHGFSAEAPVYNEAVSSLGIRSTPIPNRQ
jgi:SAM-dependent methyltransferase